MAVAAALQVDAHLLGGLHLELVHGLPGLGDIDLVVIGVAHKCSLLLLSSEENTLRRKHFLFRSHSLANVENSMSGV